MNNVLGRKAKELILFPDFADKEEKKINAILDVMKRIHNSSNSSTISESPGFLGKGYYLLAIYLVSDISATYWFLVDYTLRLMIYLVSEKPFDKYSPDLKLSATYCW